MNATLMQCRTALNLIAELTDALQTVATDQLRVDVMASALPVGAASQITVNLCRVALNLIAELTDALQSVATDRLIVRGEDQLFSITDIWREQIYTLAADAGTNTFSFTTVPANQIWVLNAFAMYDKTTAITRLAVGVRDTGGIQQTFAVVQGPGIWEANVYSGWMPLGPGERVRAYFYGCVAGDDIYAHCHGFKMTLEV